MRILNVIAKTWKIQVLGDVMLVIGQVVPIILKDPGILTVGELLACWHITFHKTRMFGIITMRTSNFARKALSL
jgi:hypothetical protein